MAEQTSINFAARCLAHRSWAWCARGHDTAIVSRQVVSVVAGGCRWVRQPPLSLWAALARRGPATAAARSHGKRAGPPALRPFARRARRCTGAAPPRGGGWRCAASAPGGRRGRAGSPPPPPRAGGRPRETAAGRRADRAPRRPHQRQRRLRQPGQGAWQAVAAPALPARPRAVCTDGRLPPGRRGADQRAHAGQPARPTRRPRPCWAGGRPRAPAPRRASRRRSRAPAARRRARTRRACAARRWAMRRTARVLSPVLPRGAAYPPAGKRPGGPRCQGP